MNTKWHILYFESLSGNSPIYEFIENLKADAQAKIANTLDLLEKYGVQLGSPHIKKIKNADLWELRIVGSTSIRILYVAISEKTFLLLHAFQKKKQQIDKKDIKVAQQRFRTFMQNSLQQT